MADSYRTKELKKIDRALDIVLEKVSINEDDLVLEMHKNPYLAVLVTLHSGVAQLEKVAKAVKDPIVGLYLSALVADTASEVIAMSDELRVEALVGPRRLTTKDMPSASPVGEKAQPCNPNSADCTRVNLVSIDKDGVTNEDITDEIMSILTELGINGDEES